MQQRVFIIVRSIQVALLRAAKKRIQDEYQWQTIAKNIESAYFEILGRQQARPMENMRMTAAIVASDDLTLHRRAG